MNEIPLIPFIVFAVVMILFLILYLPSRQKYQPYIQALDKKQFSLVDFLPVGFAFMERIHYGYNHKFDRGMRKKLLELYEEEYNEFYLRVYMASFAAYLWVGLLMSALFFLASSGNTSLFALGLAMTGVMIYASYSDMNKKIKVIHMKIAIDLPDYISKIIILTSAGMTLRAAMKKVAEEMSQPTPLYQLMGQAMYNIENGMNETSALDQVVHRCNMPEMRRLIATIEQNLQRGGTDVGRVMQAIGTEMWDNRKAKAKQLAEEAETKILFPMMLMMFSVIVMVIVPAVLSMGL